MYDLMSSFAEVLYGFTVNSEKSPLSCRLHISLQGLEWFIYNRTTAYDDVVNAMDGNISRSPDGSHVRVSGEGIGSLRKIFSWTSVVPECTFEVRALMTPR